MNISFENKRVLVTGGCQGIGKECVLRMLKLKATVIALSYNQKNLDQLKKDHPEVEIVYVDLLDWKATRTAVKSVLPVDLLVNSAGTSALTHCLKVEEEEIDDMFALNVKAMLNVSQLVAENLVARKIAGSIVNLSSQACRAALLDHVTYCASKGAVDMLTKTMALELGPHNIRVNSVRPTVVMTELGRRIWADENAADDMKRKIPLGRFAEPSEVVDAIVFLLSDKAAMINGVGLPVDGGFLAT